MNRDVNNGMKYNNQVDLLPLFSAGECAENDYYELIADALGTTRENIFGCDLYLYNRMAPSIWGAKEEFISSPKLDDLQLSLIHISLYQYWCYLIRLCFLWRHFDIDRYWFYHLTDTGIKTTLTKE